MLIPSSGPRYLFGIEIYELNRIILISELRRTVYANQFPYFPLTSFAIII